MLKIITLIALGLLSLTGSAWADDVSAAPVFEPRTYTSPPGKLDTLHKRFREHSLKLLEKHGMKNIAYWIPQDPPRSANTLIYVVAHASREAAEKSWAAFRNDPEWQRVRDASEANGKIVEKVESVFMNATDYSPLK